MGYYIFSYAIDTDKVKSAFGSKNEDMLNNVLKTEEYKCYAEDDMAGYITTKEALHNIIFGESYKEGNSHVYGYALISLCSYLGERVPHGQEIKLGYETDLINKYLSSDFGINLEIEETLFSEVPEFGLPKIEDWPLSGILSSERLKHLSELFSPIEIIDEQVEDLWDSNEEDDEDKACAYEHIKGIKENIKFCLEKGEDMISFCH